MRVAPILSSPLLHHLEQAIGAAGGWLGFDRFMELALYTPGLGYYANALPKLGLMPEGGSDFATAPEMSPWFGRCLAVQVADAMRATHTLDVFEFGAGSGALAQQVLDALDAMQVPCRRYFILDLSGSLREQQRASLARFGARVQWLDAWPDRIEGLILGNEVLDAMPVQLLVRTAGTWHERGVILTNASERSELAWQDRPTGLRPPIEPEGGNDYLTETHQQAEAFVRSLAQRLVRGAAFFIDYGFGEHEYYHPQRHMGTLMCHKQHLADTDPLQDVGAKDITAHVNFTALALAAQDSQLQVLGYCNQARFLMNCGMLEMLEKASLAERAMAQKLLMEHEMGELFKVIGFAPEGTSESWRPRGFAVGDRTYTL
ncbi:MAG: hypothetical protein RLZZ126_145 [Pseudomonadota bacterium]|jgi:SAM-dependent MidA family methyltransferase